MQPASTKMITCRIKQFLCLGKGKPETYAHLHDRLGFGAVGEGVIFYAFKKCSRKATCDDRILLWSYGSELYS